MTTLVPCRAYTSGEITMYCFDRDATGGTATMVPLGSGPCMQDLFGLAMTTGLVADARACTPFAFGADTDFTGGSLSAYDLGNETGTFNPLGPSDEYSANWGANRVFATPATLGSSPIGDTAVLVGEQFFGAYLYSADDAGRHPHQDRWVAYDGMYRSVATVSGITGAVVPNAARAWGSTSSTSIPTMPALDDATLGIALGPVLRWQDERNYVYLQLMVRTGQCELVEVADGGVYRTAVPMLGPLLDLFGNGPWFASTLSTTTTGPGWKPVAGRWWPRNTTSSSTVYTQVWWAGNWAVGIRGSELYLYLPETEVTGITPGIGPQLPGYAYSDAHDQLDFPGVRGCLYVIPLRHRTVTDVYRRSSIGFLSSGLPSAPLTFGDTVPIRSRGNLVSWLYEPAGAPAKLRLAQRTDGIGAAGHPRLLATAGNPPSSVQRQAAPRLGHNNRYR